MKLTISDDASKWFAEELGLQKGDGLKFFGKGYGTSTIQPGFSLGMLVDNNPDRPVAETEKDGIKYYVNYGDAWYFFGYDLEVTLNYETNEPQYNYIKQED